MKKSYIFVVFSKFFFVPVFILAVATFMLLASSIACIRVILIKNSWGRSRAQCEKIFSEIVFFHVYTDSVRKFEKYILRSKYIQSYVKRPHKSMIWLLTFYSIKLKSLNIKSGNVLWPKDFPAFEVADKSHNKSREKDSLPRKSLILPT